MLGSDAPVISEVRYQRTSPLSVLPFRADGFWRLELPYPHQTIPTSRRHQMIGPSTRRRPRHRCDSFDGPFLMLSVMRFVAFRSRRSVYEFKMNDRMLSCPELDNLSAGRSKLCGSGNLCANLEDVRDAAGDSQDLTPPSIFAPRQRPSSIRFSASQRISGWSCSVVFSVARCSRGSRRTTGSLSCRSNGSSTSGRGCGIKRPCSERWCTMSDGMSWRRGGSGKVKVLHNGPSSQVRHVDAFVHPELHIRRQCSQLQPEVMRREFD